MPDCSTQCRSKVVLPTRLRDHDELHTALGKEAVELIRLAPSPYEFAQCSQILHYNSNNNYPLL